MFLFLALLCFLPFKFDFVSLFIDFLLFFIKGDTHGQWANLMEILKLVGEPGDKDYVTRGLHSVPIILLLFALKIRYPHRVHLLKGMAECEGIASVYGLNDECRKFLLLCCVVVLLYCCVVALCCVAL